MKQLQKPNWRSIYYIETPFQLEKPTTSFPPLQGLWYQHRLMERQELPLGANIEYLIYDIWDGFHPDAFCALCGCIKGRGALVLIGPPLDRLAYFQDPSYSSISSWPQICPTETHYLRLLQESLRRLFKTDDPINTHNQVIQISTQDMLQQYLEHIAPPRCIDTQENLPHPTAEQQAFIDGVYLKDRRWGTLFANRGFGKTTALQQLMLASATQQTDQPLLLLYVTPRKEPRDKMLAWWTLHPSLQNYIYTPKPKMTNLTLRVISLEGAVKQSKALPLKPQSSSPHMLILIDECAGFNMQNLNNALQALNTHNIKVILSSSIDGYEGSARNLQHLTLPCPYQTYALTVPLRWALHDPLDRWIKTFFFAGTDTGQDYHAGTALPEAESSDEYQVDPLYLQNCDDNERLQWVTLMQQAHYRTRPSDLRVMLDAPNQHFFCIRLQSQIIAGLWISLEGPIPSYLQDDILEGRRRLKGHLAPQYSAKQALSQGQRNKAHALMSQPWVRVVRIAVHPEYQRKQLGTCLIRACQTKYKGHRLAVSFTPKDSLQHFWRHVNLKEIRPGFFISMLTEVLL